MFTDENLIDLGIDYDSAHAVCRHTDAKELLRYIRLIPSIWVCWTCGEKVTMAGDLDSEHVRPFFEALDFGWGG